MLTSNCQGKECSRCTGQRKSASADNTDDVFPCGCECHWEQTTFYAPGQNALSHFLRTFPAAGANIVGLTIDFQGRRGDPNMLHAAIEYMIASGWSRKIGDVLFYSR